MNFLLKPMLGFCFINDAKSYFHLLRTCFYFSNFKISSCQECTLSLLVILSHRFTTAGLIGYLSFLDSDFFDYLTFLSVASLDNFENSSRPNCPDAWGELPLLRLSISLLIKLFHRCWILSIRLFSSRVKIPLISFPHLLRKIICLPFLLGSIILSFMTVCPSIQLTV